MSQSASLAAGGALQELQEVSPQILGAVVLDRPSGDVLASAPNRMSGSAKEFGAACIEILDAAEQARAELGREPVTQCEVATEDGHAFVVADTSHVVGAVTAADPTVGLVFYDLKTALRTVREAAAEIGAAGTGPHTGQLGGDVVVPVLDPGTGGADEDGEDSRRGQAESGVSRWRRKR